jgi:hypothetical protein
MNQRLDDVGTFPASAVQMQRTINSSPLAEHPRPH